MKKTLLTLSTFLLSLLAIGYTLLAPVVAQDATDSAVSEEEVKENLKKRLEKVVKDDDVLGETVEKKAFVGSLESISNDTLSIKTDTSTKQAKVAESAKIIGKDRQTLKAGDLEIGSFVIAMGYVNEQSVLDTRRVIVIDKPTTSYAAYRSKLQSIKKDTLTTITTAEPNQTWQFETDKDTSFTQGVGGKQIEIELKDLKENDILVIIAKSASKTPTVLEATAIHLVDGRTIISESAATASASPKVPPQASPNE